MWSGPSSHRSFVLTFFPQANMGLRFGSRGHSNTAIKYYTSSKFKNSLSLFSHQLHGLQKLFSSETYFPKTWRGHRMGTGDLTLPVFAVSASVSFQEFFSARGFCSSAVLLWCCGFPVSLLYVDELLSCLFEDISVLISAWHRRGATSQLGFDSDSSKSVVYTPVEMSSAAILGPEVPQASLLPPVPLPALPVLFGSQVPRCK